MALSLWFRHKIGYWPRLKSPRTFNEKILHRKLHDRNPFYGVLCDKLAVRDVVRERVGETYLSKVFQVVSDPADLDLDALPESFALKSNHGWSQVILVKRKSEFSLDAHREKLERWLAQRHGQSRWGVEWAYALVEPKLFVEELLQGLDGESPWDYKFYVFDGRVEYVHVDLGRHTNRQQRFYKREWEPIDLRRTSVLAEPAPKPERFDEMLAVAESLGQGLDFVRVDLYDVPRIGVRFGEMTLYPAAGDRRFDPEEWDFRFGECWKLRM